MKSAFLLAHEDELFSRLREALVSVAPLVLWESEAAVQVGDLDERRFSLEDEVDTYWPDLRCGSFRNHTGKAMPDMWTMNACYVECRWEDLFVSLVGEMAALLDFPMWVLDSYEAIWSADAIDIERLVL